MCVVHFEMYGLWEYSIKTPEAWNRQRLFRP